MTDSDHDRLAAYRAASDLSDLLALTGTGSEHEAYFAAKREWRRLRGEELADAPCREGLPGDCVTVDGHSFCVHGITHADTGAEREFLREHVSELLEAGATVYTEQGIREMYFRDVPDVCAMDDYRWAMERCRELGIETSVDPPGAGFESLFEDINSLTSTFRDATFSLIESGSDVYGEEFASALGDVATVFLRSHEDMATADDFESFKLNSRAAADPSRLVDLQRYYERAFLPQPLEREWLWRHDPELEVVTHARNERMADYAVYQNDEARSIHLIVGAAHQPGVRYYLERHRDGKRTVGGFAPL